MNKYILGIESSCDDTSASVILNGKLCSNIISTQKIHEKYGGVVPELASREHQKNIIPVVNDALSNANISLKDLTAIAVTKGPGLLGALMVGVSFAKGLSLATGIPLIGVNHLHGHILAHTIYEEGETEIIQEFPFLCLLISGGHTMIIIVKDFLDYQIIGQTIDDAAGEAFDKCAKVLGLPYPGGPHIDKLAKVGNPNAFEFGKPKIDNYDYSFSGLKTSFLYTVRDGIKSNPNFIIDNTKDLAASLQKSITDILCNKLLLAVKNTGIKNIAVSGGVSANSGIRNRLTEISEENNYNLYLPKLKFTTDNAAMIAKVALHKHNLGLSDNQEIVPMAKIDFTEL
jgi:N6-L-threonylcarbamoyladenine synthase